jgi:hypothetical protein
MKILYVLRSIGHFSYQAGIVTRLCREGHKVHLLVDRQWSGERSDAVIRETMKPYENFVFKWSLRRSDRWRKLVFGTREIRGYISYLKRPDQSPFYLKRWFHYTPRWMHPHILKPRYQKVLRWPVVDFLLRTFEKIVPADRAIKDHIRRIAPDIVVVTPGNMRYSEEVEYLKAAKALGIKTVTPVYSWDNLTTKGLYQVTPDLTLAWNQRHLKEAVHIHRVPRRKIVVTGAPFFDKWFTMDPAKIDAEAFFKRLGMPADPKFVLYLGSSKNIAGDETWLIRKLARTLKTSDSPSLQGVVVLARPHPSNFENYPALEQEGVFVYPKPPFSFEMSVPDTRQAWEDFYCSIHYAIATVGINTSGMLDALAADKASITVMTKEYARTQEQANHFHTLLQSKALEVAKSVEQCVERIAHIAEGHDDKKERRREFVKNFVRPMGCGKAASDAAAEAIMLFAQGKSPAEIQKLIRQDGSDKAGSEDTLVASLQTEPAATRI